MTTQNIQPTQALPTTASERPSIFSLKETDGLARRGSVRTAHGLFETPAFMPVATQGTVKGVTPEELNELGTQIVLSNTYHLHLRPGEETIHQLGGLHRFMNWNGPILTDSGGFQVHSLAKLRKLSEDGVAFQSHHDGARIFFTPEKVVHIQERLGVDIAMVLDECLSYPASETEAESALRRTMSWAARSVKARRQPELTLLFGIAQGGMHSRLRRLACEELAALPFDGYAVGGLSVGEPRDLCDEMTAVCTASLPAHTVRYLMGVGTPRDIVQAVSLGIDMFDCVMPTRSARFGRLFVGTSHINIRNSRFRTDPNPVEEGCECYTCRHYSRAYVCHLIHADEILGSHLATIHNLYFYQRLLSRIRKSIEDRRFGSLYREFVVNGGSSHEPDERRS